jgi:hypothetical protein
MQDFDQQHWPRCARANHHQKQLCIWYCPELHAWWASSETVTWFDDEHHEIVERSAIHFGPFDDWTDVVKWVSVQLVAHPLPAGLGSELESDPDPI